MPRIVALTLNPAVDISTSVEQVSPNQKLRCAPPKIYPGGGGVNVARVAWRLGGDVEVVYLAGGTRGLLLRSLIDREGIPSVVVPTTEETREDLTVIDRSTGHEYRFVFPGPTIQEHHLQSCLNVLRGFPSAPNYLVLSGSMPIPDPNLLMADIATLAADFPSRLVVDTSGKALAAAVTNGAFLIKPNLRELRELLNVPDADIHHATKAAQALIRESKVEIIVLSLGQRGSMLVSRTEAWIARIAQVDARSTVGAGDSLLGAIVWGLDSGMSLDTALRYGVAAGTAAVLRPGTELALAEDVHRLAEEVIVSPLTEEASSTSS